MTPSFSAFTDELVRIKRAQLEQPEKDEEDQGPDKKELFKQLAVNAAGYAVPFGIGTGTAWLTAEKFLPKKFPGMTSAPKRWGIGGLAGALTGLGTLATWEAMRQARKREDDAAAAGKRDD